MKRKRSFCFPFLCLSLWIVFVLSGCALGTSYVTLDYSPAPFWGEEITGKNTVLMEKTVDKRIGFLEEDDYTGDQIGFKRNSYGGVTGSVRLQGGERIQDFMTKAIGKLIESKGFKIKLYGEGGWGISDETKEKAVALLKIELIQFEVGFAQRFFDLLAVGDGEVLMSFSDPEKGSILWKENVLVKYEKGGIMAFTDDDYQETAENLLKMLMAEIEKKLPWEKLKEEAVK